MRKNSVKVQVYFENKNQERVYRKVLKLHKKTGMSVSRIGYLALQYGLPHVAEAVTGIYLDAEVNNKSLEEDKKSYAV